MKAAALSDVSDQLWPQRLRRLREARGETQTALARRVGVSSSCINLLENGKRRLTPSLLSRISAALSVPPGELTGLRDEELLSELAASAQGADIHGLAAMIAAFPQWAEALAQAQRRLRDSEAMVAALRDRLSHDHELTALGHRLLGRIAGVRSASEILIDAGGPPPEDRARLRRRIAEEARLIGHDATAMLNLLSGARAMEAAQTPSGPTPAQIDAIESAASAPATEAERALALRAAALPRTDFAAAAVQARFDIGVLAARFNVDEGLVMRRIADIDASLLGDARFGYLRIDPAGRILDKAPLPGLLTPSPGAGCPLWAVFAALLAPGVVVQLAETPDAARYLMIARRFDSPPARFGGAGGVSAAVLVCDAMHLDATVYGDGFRRGAATLVTPVGLGCRICARADCAQRGEPQAARA